MEERTIHREHTEHVVLDIGGDTGCLVIYTDAPPPGAEIEVEPVAPAGRRTHTGVLPRRIGGKLVGTAVFAGLRHGRYRVVTDRSDVESAVTVTGGRVVELDWRTR